MTGNCNEKFVNRNLCSGITDMYWLNTTVKSCGYGAGTENKGLIIPVDGGNYTISTTIVQSVRYRVACLNSLPVSSVVVPADRGVNKDNTNDTITIDTTGYKYLIINATDLTSIQIEKGSTATAYVSHAEQNAPLSLGNIEAYEGDEIEIDYVQKAGYKKVTGARLVQNMGKVVLDGSETNWKKSPNTNVDRYAINTSDYIPNVNSKCNYFIRGLVSDYSVGKFSNNASVQLLFNFAEYGTTTLEDWLTWLSTHNLELVQPLATPVTTEITDPTLLAQFETLINMKTYKEVTNIELTGEDLAPVLDCDYYQDMSSLNDRLDTLEARIELLES